MVSPVLLLLTIVLVVVGAVSLLIGFVNDQMFPIYLSIACSVIAAVVLLVFSRLSRTRLEPAGRPVVAPAAETTVLSRTEAVPVVSGDDDSFPIAEYDDLRVSEILPLLPELDLDELEAVREREERGRARASIIRRIDELADDLEARTSAPAASAGGGDDDLFPIEDYDDLRVSEILPLLDELEPDELEDVAARERSGAARASILGRIDSLLGGEPATATIAATPASDRAATTKAATKKTPAKKSTAAKSATGAKKAGAKKAAPKKATPAKAAPKKATTAKKAPAKKTGGAKKA